MTEKKEDDLSPKLPQGYEYIEKYTLEAQQKLLDIDQKIEDLKVDRIDADYPRPLGEVRQTAEGRRNSEHVRFLGQKEDVKTELSKKVENEIGRAEPEDADATRLYVQNSVKDGVYNAPKPDLQKEFEKKQENFESARNPASASDKKANSNEPAVQSSSRSDGAFSSSNYNIQNVNVNFANVNLGKDNPSEKSLPDQENASRSDRAFGKSNFDKERSVSNDEVKDSDEKPKADKDEKGDEPQTQSRSDDAFSKSNYNKNQEDTKSGPLEPEKNGETPSKSEPTPPSDPGGGKFE